MTLNVTSLLSAITLIALTVCQTGIRADDSSSAAKPFNVARLEIFPSSITLDDLRARAQLVITAFDEQGNVADVTHQCLLSLSEPSVASLDAARVKPLAAGRTELIATLGQQSARIPVEVKSLEHPRPVAFESEVLVALSKQGCNSGACHGSPSGKGGFRLSLRAFDAELDALTITREEFGRRINLMEPDKSLLLEKPLMMVAHGGGLQVRKHDVAYEVLRDWVAVGAPLDPPQSPRIARVEIYPKQRRILSAPNHRQQLAVIAHFEDGRTCDVTQLAAYSTSNANLATVSADGLVQASGRGEAAVLVRVLEHIESLPLMFVADQPGFQWPNIEASGELDRLVDAKLKQLQYVPAEKCSDAEFLRRVTLDVTGLLPTVEQTREFLDSTKADKRSAAINRLLDSPEYAKFWALKWGDWLRLTSKRIGDDAIYKYHRWIEDSLASNQPYDKFVTELLAASGSTFSHPPANFYRTAGDMHECVETFSQLFMGARLQCAKCHNHPFERWTQDNYYGLAAFFDRVQRKKSSRPGEMFIWVSDTGEVTQPRTGKAMKPWLPGTGPQDIPNDADRRTVLVDWLAKTDNPYLARIEVNRIWGELFARGIVDPVDDFRDSNPPSNSELLDYLTHEFVHSGFDRKHVLRLMLNSRTYQASYQTTPLNQDDVQYFSHQEPRLLGAEQLLDAINQVTGVAEPLGALPEQTKATQLPAPDLVKLDFLKVFGQPERSTVCACERTAESNLGMAIEFFNGPFIHKKLRDENNRFRKAMAAGRSDDEIITDLYLAAVCRTPSSGELDVAKKQIQTRGDRAAGFEDICWALLNTDEFLFQH